MSIVPSDVRIFVYPDPGPDLIILFAAMCRLGKVNSCTYKNSRVAGSGGVEIFCLYIFVSDAEVIESIMINAARGECIEVKKELFDQAIDSLAEKRENDKLVEQVLKGVKGGGGDAAKI